MERKPFITEIQEYLKNYNPLNLKGASVSLISEHNHLHYKLEKDGKAYCLRMINPESYRAGEWLSIADEHTLLKSLEPVAWAPRSYFVDPERFIIPLMIQQFIADATCFNNLKLTKEHLITTAQTIADLNFQNINPNNFPFRQKFTRLSYLTSLDTWRKRLAEIEKSKQKDVLEWAEKIRGLVNQSENILKEFEPLLEKSPWVFNFDGAHCGNTYWWKNRVIFLDWQKVSYGDPAFTLARFLTSIDKAGEISTTDKKVMVEAYLQKRPVRDFEKLVEQRLFERQVADLVWVVWEHVRRKDQRPVEEATDVVARYKRVKKLIE